MTIEYREQWTTPNGTPVKRGFNAEASDIIDMNRAGVTRLPELPRPTHDEGRSAAPVLDSTKLRSIENKG